MIALDDLKPSVRPQDRLGYVYHTVFTRPTDGQQFHYIGQHLGKRLDKRYSGSGLLLRRIIKKYGRAGNTRLRILSWEASQDDLNATEKFFIMIAKRLHKKYCLNLEYGGAEGTRSAITRAKISATKRGRSFTPEHRAALSAARKGRRFGPL